MPRRNAKPVDPIEMGEQHGRCNWEGLRDQDRLLAHQPQDAITRQRLRCPPLNRVREWQALALGENESQSLSAKMRWY